VALPSGPFTATGTPTIQFTAVNDAPTLTANAFAIKEGETITLSSTSLLASDEETTDPTKLVYTVDKVSNGSFRLTAGGAALSTFTQADVNTGKVQFVHDGSEAAPSYTLTVKDSGIPGDTTPKSATQTVVFDGNFTNLNDLPEILANNLAISEGGLVTLTTNHLNASDLETLSNDLKITITGIQGGSFLLDGVPFGGAVQFTLADVVLQRISFQHNGTETVPTYLVTVQDADGGSSSPVPVTVTRFERVNDNPEILKNTFSITEGGRVILGKANLDAADEVGETPRLALKYNVSNVVGGRFELGSTSGTAITSFTQADIDAGRIIFVHDGSDTTPNYTLTVTDSEGGTDVESSPTVTFTRVNQAPELVNNKLSILEGGTVVLSQANL
ncbi:MAG: hypothetical protein ICV77_18355, partial [Cyanobacteria bacterium Co-bin8]|nr:hypothetical protein [Cyanobacteria bacterium Co-bin8]